MTLEGQLDCKTASDVHTSLAADSSWWARSGGAGGGIGCWPGGEWWSTSDGDVDGNADVGTSLMDELNGRA